MKTTRKIAAVAVSILALAAVATASYPSRVVIHGPHESQVCDVTELHTAASRFEQAFLVNDLKNEDRDRLVNAVSHCAFTGGESHWDIVLLK